MAIQKTVCQITRVEFKKAARPQTVNVAGKNLEADVKEFSTGSIGWYANGKVNVEIDGKLVPVHVGVTMTVVGSKELPPE